MKRVNFGPNVTVFVLFLALSLLDAVWSQDWRRTPLWLALGAVFLRADALKPRD